MTVFIGGKPIKFTPEMQQNPLFNCGVTKVYTGCCSYQTFIVQSTGQIYAIGRNLSGQLAYSIGDSRVAVQLNGKEGTTFWRDHYDVQIAIGGYSTVAILSNRPLLTQWLNPYISSFTDILIYCNNDY
jgi:alpha-tubulin suppressor-like RCC1 family protein